MNNFTRAIADALTSEYEQSIPNAPEHEFSEKFERKMKKLIKRREMPFYMLINTAGKRVAGIVIGILIAMSTAIISVDALREGFMDFITMIFGDHSVVRSAEPEGTPETIEEIYGITADLSGYEIIYEEHSTTSVRIDYVKDNLMVTFRQHTKNVSINHNTEDAAISSIDINGCEAIYYFDNHNYHNIIWDNGDYIIYLDSNIGKNELIAIAESVQKIEK